MPTQYHSIYDDFYWYTHFVDTDFSYGRALAQTGGTAVLRLANADVIPFEYGEQADTIAKYVKELEKLLKDKQDEISERNLELQEGVFTATADPHKTFVPPPAKPMPPFMNFAPLKNGAGIHQEECGALPGGICQVAKGRSRICLPTQLRRSTAIC